ncbi:MULTISPECIES: MarR family winged helix-turn-helix transcriptional regulator [Streptomyces]|uniref:MarR family winged helix-turn-helix transcriptional regulator n=1 Tax=Streptomyces TaxID=1883 RepID=UPI00163BD696|nr:MULTISPECIES: MarR family transcriptional regulator [Streptomyces]MBC2878460.1 MarR family transcriptional regulator [Streptomyces sp. TYQ1024]UBI38792.1 MarR family transcriptional regulator [Streptomyces mobaraensis]UKW31373.1 MarR family transcriptional regulator [Streptomyces sp. TYQ1024]
MSVKPTAGGAGGSADALADHIMLAMTDLAGALGRLHDRIAQQLNVAPTDLLCLHTLDREGPTTAGTLSTRLGRTTGAVTHMLDRLEKGGYVHRRPHPEDRRRVIVEASPEGLRRIAAYYKGLDARSRTLASDFSPQELQAILRFLTGSRNDVLAETEELPK